MVAPEDKIRSFTKAIAFLLLKVEKINKNESINKIQYKRQITQKMIIMQ